MMRSFSKKGACASAIVLGLGASFCFGSSTALGFSSAFGDAPSLSDLPKSDLAVWRQIISLENQRRVNPPLALTQLEMGSDFLAKKSALALGRTGHPKSWDPLFKCVQKRPSVEVRRTCAFSLGLLKLKESEKALLQEIDAQQDAGVRKELWVALGRLGLRTSFDPIKAALLNSEKDPVEIAGAVEGLVHLWQVERKDWGAQEELFVALLNMLKIPELRPFASVSLARFRGDRTRSQASLLTQSLNDNSTVPSVRPLLIVSLAGIKDAPEFLTPSFSLRSQTETVEWLGGFDRQSASETLVASLFGSLEASLKKRETRVAVAALESLVGWSQAGLQLKPSQNALLVELLGSEQPLQLRRNALQVLAVTDPALAEQSIRTEFWNVIDGTDLSLGGAAQKFQWQVLKTYPSLLTHSPQARLPEAMEGLADLLLSNDDLLVGAALEGLSVAPQDLVQNLPRAQYLFGTVLNRSGLGGLCGVSLMSLDFLKSLDLESDFSVAWSRVQDPLKGDERLCLLQVFEGFLKSASAPARSPILLGIVQGAQKDPHVFVAAKAREVLRNLGEKSLKEPVLQTMRTPGPLPESKELKTLLQRPLVKLSTPRGELLLELSPETPLTSVSFLRLVQSGFYNGLDFHRVVPNFVVQGGDPLGDGSGGPRYFVRDEVGQERHLPGSMGIATSGKDTGGSQFFFNETSNIHLGGSYTVFAKVVKGQEIVAQIQESDAILSAAFVGTAAQ